MERDWWKAPASRICQRFAFNPTVFGFATKEVKDTLHWAAIQFYFKIPDKPQIEDIKFTLIKHGMNLIIVLEGYNKRQRIKHNAPQIY